MTSARRRPGATQLRLPRIPADATAVRIVAADRSLGLGDWIAVTPPRVPELRSVEYVGSTQPVLMDWAVGLAFPCQQPMLHANGVTEVPKFRITPDHTAKKRDTTPTPGRTGATAVCSGITDLLLAPARGDLPVARLGLGLGLAAPFDTIVDADVAGSTWHRHPQRPVEAGPNPIKA